MNHYSTTDTVTMTHGWEVGKAYHKSGLGHKVLYAGPHVFGILKEYHHYITLFKMLIKHFG